MRSELALLEFRGVAYRCLSATLSLNEMRLQRYTGWDTAFLRPMCMR